MTGFGESYQLGPPPYIKIWPIAGCFSFPRSSAIALLWGTTERTTTQQRFQSIVVSSVRCNCWLGICQCCSAKRISGP